MGDQFDALRNYTIISIVLLFAIGNKLHGRGIPATLHKVLRLIIEDRLAFPLSKRLFYSRRAIASYMELCKNSKTKNRDDGLQLILAEIGRAHV